MIIDVIPEIELIIGPQPPVQVLAAIEAQNRFNLVFQSFVHALCQAEHPLVIFLDDLQWVDPASLRLIELMLTDEALHHLFLIMAYRDNEVFPTYPFMMALERLRKTKINLNQITLTPLNLDQVAHLLADTLHSGLQVVNSLAELIMRKTGGNPFFVNQFLQTLYQEDLLTFYIPKAGDYGQWQWNVEQIEALDITDNVVELMLSKLKKLPIRTQQVLRLAAGIGNRFNLQTLSIIDEKPVKETFQDLMSAIQFGLILPTSELEMTEADILNSNLLVLNFKFLHDRVQQAAYALIDEDQKKAVHLKISQLLLAKISPQERAERIFEVVDHLNVGKELLTITAEKIQLAALNLEAGQKAKEATAYAAASAYLSQGIENLTAHCWEEYYSLTFALHQELATVAYLNGQFFHSEALINLTLSHAKSVSEQAEIYYLLIVQYTLRARCLDAIQIGRQALALVGIHLPQDNLPAAVEVELAATAAILAEQDLESLFNQPPVTDPEKKVALKLLANLAAPTFVADQALFPIINLKASTLSLRYGASPESPIGYANHGLVLVSRDKLLTSMMNVVIENAGAQHGFLLVEKSGQWLIEASGAIDKTQTLTPTSTLAERLPISIINYVAHTHQTVVLNDAQRDNQFGKDNYIINQQPKSILAHPLPNQGKLTGILYLENNLTTSAFTPKRLQILNMLSAQVAISIENAYIYNNLEQKVVERTRELSETLARLKSTQTQLIESEKMASLGNLVAGVAHEINTPLGIGITAASTLDHKTKVTAIAFENKELKGSALKTYLEVATRSSQMILNNLERAGNLVQSFKQVAVDQTHLDKRKFTVKKYIKDTLTNLTPHLKQTPHQITINGEDDLFIISSRKN